MFEASSVYGIWYTISLEHREPVFRISMNLLEYQAKQALKRQGLTIPKGVVIQHPDDVADAIVGIDSAFWMMKAQIRAGERADHGGIVRADNITGAHAIAQHMLGSRLKTPQTAQDGDLVSEVLIEAGCPPVRELYLAALVNPANADISIVASPVGGSVVREIELASMLADSNIIKLQLGIDEAPGDLHFATLIDELSIEASGEKEFSNILSSVVKILRSCDAMLVEINPLAILEDGSFVCLDCKISIDDNALHRQDWISATRVDSDDRRASRAASGFNFENLDGDIASIATGAGLALATNDFLIDHRFKPANFLDLPPGASKDTVATAVRTVFDYSEPAALVVNARAGGFTSLAVIADGIAAANAVIANTPVVVHFAGSGRVQAWQQLQSAGLRLSRVEKFADLPAVLTDIIKSESRHADR